MQDTTGQYFCQETTTTTMTSIRTPLFNWYHILFFLLAFSIQSISVVSSTKMDDQYCTDTNDNANDSASCTNIQLKWGLIQDLRGPRETEMQNLLNQTIDYMTKIVYADDKYVSVRADCKNRHKLCTLWAYMGECTKNKEFMTIECAPSCQTCDQISFEMRCPYDDKTPMTLNQKGDLNHLFERILTLEVYKPKIYSRPSSKSMNDKIGNDQQNDDSRNTPIMDGPWLVALENFLTPSECDRLIELGSLEGFERSVDVGEKRFDGTYASFENNGRTSQNAWCEADCSNDAVVQQIHSKIEKLTDIPQINYEFLQLLKYEEGQYYRRHHDYIMFQRERNPGVRILTVFLYLNDVEEGGGTHFPSLQNLVVTPKRGMALVWPSVLDENPNEKDPRMYHSALPVKKGTKYGANAWIHQRDFKTSYENRCL